MSEAAVRERIRKQGWAQPGGAHDLLVRVLKIVLPLTIGVLIAFLAMAPLQKGPEISFLLDKNKVAVATERMRVQAARSQGQDDKGRSFTIRAVSAVQATSRDPIVDVLGMSAEIGLASGPARLRADRGRSNMDSQIVEVTGPVVLTASDGYRLATSNVGVDLNTRRLHSRGSVEGNMPLGRFSADRMLASLDDKRVMLTGRARLQIDQGRIR